MKTIKYILGLLFFVIINACNNDDDANSLRIEYEKTFIENTFLETGETPAPIVNWLEEKGSFTATSMLGSKGDDLVGRVVFIDEETGVLSWNRSFPIGERDIYITAANSSQTATVTITIKNTFTEGFFVGGFNNDTSEEPDISTIMNDTFLILSKEGNVALSSSSENDVSFIGTGTWIADDSNITINYTISNMPGENLTMTGYLNGSTSLPAASFIGQWGKGLNQDNTIESAMGLFSFEND
ncbi:hypothetical protein [Aquimarina sp. 2201CG14-23]|uniref:hypothetical protein n=1 Tax=Aquimarina mycalae TaxID=3040073 RepID=UPI0024781F2F|nr:hypothetical protein [Aquimarina sp. 2201CG14-23]MDH7446251.1 hypothetical protein [Aquimarina sp. 2201CG14-23]